MRDQPLGTIVLCAFGALNALLYASLLPLWEGFDEPFHYASVQAISRQGRLPVLGKTGVSDEIRASLKLAPASHVVRRNLPQVITFDEFFRLPADERAGRKAALAAVNPALGDRITADGSNYEAQQAPLAYVLLAPLDRLWRAVPLPARVWRLRLVCALSGVLASAWATLALGRSVGLTSPFREAAVFLVLSSQMLYGAAAHVANDWLSVALMPVLLLAAVRYQQAPSGRSAAWMGIALALGLLSKAYFLVLLPVPIALLWRYRRGAAALAAPVLLLAAPWYARNYVLYGNITGLMDVVTRPGPREIAGAALSIPWGTVAAASARRALWTANNSFDTFSAATLNVLLILILAAAAAGAATFRRKGSGESVLAAAIILFGAMLAYSTSVLYLTFGETAFGGAPWYVPAVFAPVFVLLAGGLERSGTVGRVLLTGVLAGWAYVLAATWWLKLIPLYGGYGGRIRVGALAGWYRSGASMLGDTALVSPATLLVLAGISAFSALSLAGWLCRRVWVERH